MQRGNGVEKSLTHHFIGQTVGDGGIDAVQIAQGVGVLSLGEAADDERPRITRREVLEFANPFHELPPLSVSRLLGGINRRHVVHLHIGRRFLEMQHAGLAAGILKSRLQIDPRLGPAAMAARAVFVDERADLFLEDLLSIRP